MSPHVVCVYQGGRYEVVGRYEAEGDAARAMRALGPTAHVVVDGELAREHPAMTDGMRRGIERALVAGTHPALPLARYAAAPAPEPVEPPAAPAEPPEPVEPAPEEQPAADEPEAEEESADEAPAGPSLDEVAELTEVALRTAGTQRVLAEALGVSEATVNRALNRTRRVGDGAVDALRAYVASHPAPPQAPAEGAAALFERAVGRAGSVHLLAAAIGRDHSGLYRARASGSCSPALVEALRAYVEGPARVEAEARQPAPRAPRYPAPARASGSAVTLRLERYQAERLYRVLAGTGEQTLRLALADALLGAA